MTPMLAAFVFVFGTIVGSFLNAVLWRLRTGESFVSGRSYCPSCRQTLAPKDLVPVLSFLLLGGRCRYCRKGISPSYMIIELTTGALFFLAARSVLPVFVGAIGATMLAKLLLEWYLIAVFTIVFVFDLRYMLILRSVTLPATVIAAVANLALGMAPVSLAAGMLVGAGVFWLQYALSKGRWVGGGDVQFGLLMGAALGLTNVLAALLLAYVAGALFGVVLLASGRKDWKSPIPFGTFLAAASTAALLYGDKLVGWYFGLL